MKRLLFINDSPGNRITYYLLAAFLVSLPFDRFYSQLILAAFILHTLIHLDRQKLRKAFSRDTLILSSVWLIGLAGLLYAPEKSRAWDDLVRQFAILLIPFFLAASGFPLARYRTNLLQLFAITCVLIIVYLYAHALYMIITYRLPLSAIVSPIFINHHFSAPIGIHATYLSLYAGLSFVFFMHWFYAEKNRLSRNACILCMLILLVGLVQLASRSVLIASLFIFLVAFPIFLPSGSIRFRFASVAVLACLMALGGIFSVDSFKARYVTGLKNDLAESTAHDETLEPRAIRWKFALELIQEKPLLGYGSGSEKELLKDIYYEKKFYTSYLHELNTHNQYLSIWLKTGLLGLLVFVATLTYGFALSWKRRDILFAAFLSLISIVSFSENIFDVNKGIFFYAFFFSFFTWQRSEKPPA